LNTAPFFLDSSSASPILRHVFTYQFNEVLDRTERVPLRVRLVVVDTAGRRSPADVQIISFTNPFLDVSGSQPGGWFSPPKPPDPCPGRSASVIAPLPALGGTAIAPVQGGALRMAHRCPPGEVLCGGSLVGTLVLGGPRPSAAQRRRRSPDLRVTRKLDFVIKPGTTARLSLALNSRGRKLLRRGSLRRVRLTYTPLAQQGNPKSRTRVVRVRRR
jgi:hypothetical protein